MSDDEMTDIPMTFTWFDKPRDELSREELYQVIDYLIKAKTQSEESLRSVIDIQKLAMKRMSAPADAE